MPNNPNAPTTAAPNTDPANGENQGEVSRQTAQELGEKSNEQVYIEKLLAEREALIAKRDELAELEQKLAQEIEQEEQALANGGQSSAASGEEQTTTTPEGEGAPQTEAEKTFNKSKKSTAFKVAIAATAVAAIALVTGAIATWFGGNNNQTATPDRPGVTDVTEAGSTAGESKEAEGIYDGYGEKGMWLSQNKGGQYDFSSAKEVAEVCDDDECEMIKYTSHNQVESYADYLANLPEELQPEGFKGLTILETEKKLEGLSKEEFESIKQQCEKVIGGAFTRDVTLNGYYHNSYMRLIDPSKPATHDNMELVECVTYENGTGAVELFWTDDGTANGKIIGTMTIKVTRDDNGNITGGCLQVVNPIDSDTHVYNGMEKITENPPTETPDQPTTPTTPDKPDTPTENIKPKDAENLQRIDQDILDQVAEEIQTGQVNVTPNPGVRDDEQTPKPASESYEGTEAAIVQNDDSTAAEDVGGQISYENEYTENRGGANMGEYAPVQDNQAAQNAADESEIPVNEAPTGGTELQDILGELGIN